MTWHIDKLYQLLFYFMQRVLEQRVTGILDKILVKPSLMNQPPVQEGGLLLVCRYLLIFVLVHLPSINGIRIQLLIFVFSTLEC